MDATMENKMGLPPPYDQATNPAPPPSYFGANPPPPAGFVPPTAPRTQVITNQQHHGHHGHHGQGHHGQHQQQQNQRPPKLGPGPTGVTCVTCSKQVVTTVEYESNNKTHIVSAALCVLAGCCCGCLFPYCMRSCKTANHYCPQCKAFVGSHQPK